MKNIVLVGLPGSGKTTLGKQLAAEMNLAFIDLDSRIEEMAGLPIGRLFSAYGEDFFRELEANAARRAAQAQGAVIAAGGGTVLRPDNAAALSQNGFVIFLDRPPAAIAQDIETAHRPLLRGGAELLAELAQQRRRHYVDCADYVLDNSGSAGDVLRCLKAACLPLAATEEYAVIGDPVAHSLSPVIQAAAFKAGGVQAGYGALHLPRGMLAPFVAGLRASALRGINLTLPHKEAIIPLLDTVHPAARQCGAVNTVVRRGEQLHGFNTDMQGLALSLRRAGHGFAGRRVLLLGAGGAARAVALQACGDGAAALHIVARQRQKAELLAAMLGPKPGAAVHTEEWNTAALHTAAAQCDMLVNSTPLGMHGVSADFEDLSFLGALPAGALVCDLIYTPPETALLAAARARGYPVLNGLGMLVYQALLAQQLFLDTELDIEYLFEAAQGALLSGGKGRTQ